MKYILTLKNVFLMLGYYTTSLLNVSGYTKYVVAIMKTDEQCQKDRQHHILMNSKSEHKSLQPAVHRPQTSHSKRSQKRFLELSSLPFFH